MKKMNLIALITIVTFACGGEKQQSDQEAEEQAVEAISNDLTDEQQELESETEESLNEIDSLLQNVE